jgi:DnaA family protein
VNPQVKPQQFVLDLLPAPQPTLENFVAGPNGAALAALQEARAGRGPQFLHLWGEPGSGRTHLLRAMTASAGNALSGALPVPQFSPQEGLFAVDDVQELDAQGQAALFQLQNEVRQHPGSILLTAADQPPAQLALREDVRTRLAWGLVFALRRITQDEQAAALDAYARARGARVDEELIPFMLTRLPRDMSTLVAVLDALDAFALARHRALTVRLLREWLQEQAQGS